MYQPTATKSCYKAPAFFSGYAGGRDVERVPFARSSCPDRSRHVGSLTGRKVQPQAAALQTAQQAQADHKVWLKKCAPRAICAQPNNPPSSHTAANAACASTGRYGRHKK